MYFYLNPLPCQLFSQVNKAGLMVGKILGFLMQGKQRIFQIQEQWGPRRLQLFQEACLALHEITMGLFLGWQPDRLIGWFQRLRWGQ
jgi:hypothetical protein